ncbi:hypothetical protein ACB092_01G294900 [Castanea dentata]
MVVVLLIVAKVKIQIIGDYSLFDKMIKRVSMVVPVRCLMLGLSGILCMGTFTMSTRPHYWSIPKYIKRSILSLPSFYFRTYMELKEPGGTLINILTTIISIENRAAK